MSPTLRPATAEECRRLWPAVANDRVFETAEQFYAYREKSPWTVRVSEKGDACVLGVWRAHLDVLAMRGVWCAERLVPAVCADALTIAREHGFGRLVSPLLPEVLLDGYRKAGLRSEYPIVAIQGLPSQVAVSQPSQDVRLSAASEGDIAELVELDAACFEPFWGYGEVELTELLATERAVTARTDSGELIGYTLATVSRGAATLGRLAVSPDARRRGVGRALVSDVARWASDRGAMTMSLCTQEENTASRALYRACGLHEIEDRYAMAIRDVGDES